MAAATLLPSSLDVLPATPSISISPQQTSSNAQDDEAGSSMPNMATTPTADETLVEEAVHLAALYKSAMTTILASPINPSQITDQADKTSMLALPLHKPAYRIPDVVSSLPRRKSSRGPLAAVLSSLLFPGETGSLSTLIKYEDDRKRIRDYVSLQRRFDVLYNTARNEETTSWDVRIRKQGVWKPSEGEMEVLKKGAPALPMPVKVPGRREFEPFLEWVAQGGTHELPAVVSTSDAVAVHGKDEEVPELDSDSENSETSTSDNGEPARNSLFNGPVPLNNGDGEDHYHTPGLEFPRGVLYEDARLDLCKQVVGPDHIGALMQSLHTNTFVRHFLLGNNIIGPTGARAIAEFVHEFPDRMDTWYLAGNCIDGAGFKILVDAMVKSTSVTNIWLKRNPLGAGAAGDLARLITGCENLRTLDLDQTELGDEGAVELFKLLADHQPKDSMIPPLRNLYLNGTGISTRGAAALGSFLASPAGASVESVYMSCNPLTDTGALALAEHLPQAQQLKRLIIQSTGINAKGATAICTALHGSESLTTLDLGQAFATADLGAGWNYITDEAVDAIVELVQSCKGLEYLNLSRCALSFNGLACVLQAVVESQSILVWQGTSVVGRLKAASVGDAPIPSPSLAYPINPATMFGTFETIIAETDIHVLETSVRDTLERNVQARYGEETTYRSFWDNEKRWVVSDQLDVRKIDSVYRTRDMRSARKGEMVLVKRWDEEDDTLERVMGLGNVAKPGLEGLELKGPVCPLKKLRLEQQVARMALA